jgi:hypothetical protein
MRNWEKPIRIAVILVMLLVLLSPLASAVFADDGTTADPPSSEESEPPAEDETEDESEAPEASAPADDPAPAAVDVPIEDETCPADEAAAAESDAGETEEPTIIIDPYFYILGTRVEHVSIQDAIDDLSGSGLTPDNGEIWVEDGTLDENVLIDGNAWNGGATTPTELILQSENGSGVTIIDGNVIIQNMQDFSMIGFEITEGLTAVDNTGTLTIEDVVATNPNGDAISVENHTGDVVVSNVHASGAANGADDNVGNGVYVDVNAGGSITLTGVYAVDNEESGAMLVFDGADSENEINVTDSKFKLNDDFGVLAQPESGTVTFNCVKAYANEDGAVMVPVGEEVIWVKCEPKDDGKKEYKECKITDKSDKYVNAGDGIMIKFPPIDPLEDEDASYASYRTIKEPNKLPADLPEGEIFMVGVDILIYNAEVPEDETIQIEFFIAGYQWEEDFEVLWYDVETAEWVSIPFTKEPHARIPGGKIVAEWDQPGIFVLVMQGEVSADVEE